MDEALLNDDQEGVQRKIALLPTRSGVYLYRNAQGTVIYVGKAKNLRSRVRSYFQEGRPVDAKTKALVRHIRDVDVIVTDTEVEALILENNLIKQHRPKYNIMLRDDKSYPYIRVTSEEYPRIFKTRRVVKDGSRYFGPYTDGTYLHYLMKTLRALFPLRSCDLPLTTESIAAGKYKLCLDYHIKKCEAPCENLVTKEHYQQHIKHALHILNGHTKEVERQLEQQMYELSDALRFEDAAIVRHRLEKLRDYTAKQKVMSQDEIDRDVFAIARISQTACIVVFIIRDGKLVDKKHYIITQCADDSVGELLRSTLEQWYVEHDDVPREILLPTELSDDQALIAYLSEKRGGAVDLIVPVKGDKKKMVAMTEVNADMLLREHLTRESAKDQTVPRAVLSLQRDLHMKKIPQRIECFDNSHMQGTDYVSSMVVFIDGKPKKSEYRRYRLQTVVGNDDFKAMQEVMTRRYTSADPASLPDLIVIDGGKGQLSHALEVLDHLGVSQQATVIGLAKRLEEVYLPGQSDALYLSKTSSSLRLLQQLRDEAHRFAVTYHRSLRASRTLQTELLEIPGIGKTYAERLLIRFGSVERVKHATLKDVADVIGEKAARVVYGYFHHDAAAADL